MIGTSFGELVALGFYAGAIFLLMCIFLSATAGVRLLFFFAAAALAGTGALITIGEMH